MTTGPEHYREAERELDAFGLVSADLKGLDLLAVTKMHAAMARAQVHATLALAAATALNDAGGMDRYDFGEWHKMLSANPNARRKVDRVTGLPVQADPS
jgi:hypothetical protein